MGFGFLAAWPLPVAGVLVMVLGAVVSAIVAERTILPELVTPPGAADGTPSPEVPDLETPSGAFA